MAVLICVAVLVFVAVLISWLYCYDGRIAMVAVLILRPFCDCGHFLILATL